MIGSRVQVHSFGVAFLGYLAVCLSLCLAVWPQSIFAVDQKETAEDFIQRAKKAIKNSEWDRAGAALKQAVKLNPKAAEAYFLLSEIHEHFGRIDIAIEGLEIAARLQPVYPEAHLMLAQLLLKKWKSEQARKEALTAMAQGAKPIEGYAILGDVAYEQSRFKEAIEHYETALRHESSDQEVAKQLQTKIEITRQFAKLIPEQLPDGVVRPKPLNNPYPRYTEEARQLKIQGRVQLAVLVSEQGKVVEAKVFSGLGHGLDESAVAAVRALKFSPATKDGKPIPYWIRTVVEFELRENK